MGLWEYVHNIWVVDVIVLSTTIGIGVAWFIDQLTSV